MREYALTRAVAIGEAGGTSWLRRFVRNWRARRSMVSRFVFRPASMLGACWRFTTPLWITLTTTTSLASGLTG